MKYGRSGSTDRHRSNYCDRYLASCRRAHRASADGPRSPCASPSSVRGVAMAHARPPACDRARRARARRGGLRLAAPALLRRIREAYDGPMILLKGAETAPLSATGAAAVHGSRSARPRCDAASGSCRGGFTELEGSGPEAAITSRSSSGRGCSWGSRSIAGRTGRDGSRRLRPTSSSTQRRQKAWSDTVCFALPAHHAPRAHRASVDRRPMARLGQLVDYWLMSHEADADGARDPGATLGDRTALGNDRRDRPRVLLGHRPLQPRGSGHDDSRQCATRTVLGIEACGDWSRRSGACRPARRWLRLEGVRVRLPAGFRRDVGRDVSRTAGALRQSFGPRSQPRSSACGREAAKPRPLSRSRPIFDRARTAGGAFRRTLSTMSPVTTGKRVRLR